MAAGIFIFGALSSSVFLLQDLGHLLRRFLASPRKPQLYNRIKSVSEKFNMILNIAVYMLFFRSFGIIY